MSVRRRGNGLTAQSYVPLIELDPRLGDRLLGALAAGGVAAYLTPSAGRSGAFLETQLPARPLDAVHVDAARRPEARRVLEATMPDVTAGLPTVDEEDQFAALVAGWDEPLTERTWPDVEEVEPAPGDPPDSPRSTEPGQADPPAASGPARVSLEKSSPLAPASARSDQAPGDPSEAEARDEDLEEHFEPPEIEPAPPTHPVTKWSFVALGLGLLLLIVPTLIGLEHSTSTDFFGVLCIIGAVGLLVSRLHDGSSDDPDDGAVV